MPEAKAKLALFQTPGVRLNLPALRYQNLYRWVGWALIATILALSLLRIGVAGLPVPNGDKWGHMLAYFALTAWYAQWLRRWPELAWRALGFVLLGGLIELLQAQTSYRRAEWADLGADALGVAAGYGLAFTPLARVLRYIETRWRA